MTRPLEDVPQPLDDVNWPLEACVALLEFDAEADAAPPKADAEALQFHPL